MQSLRRASSETDGWLREERILICDCDPKWSRRVEHCVGTAGVCVVRTVDRSLFGAGSESVASSVTTAGQPRRSPIPVEHRTERASRFLVRKYSPGARKKSRGSRG